MANDAKEPREDRILGLEVGRRALVVCWVAASVLLIAGVSAVFTKDNELGTVGLLSVGAICLIVAVGRRLPTRLEAGGFKAELVSRVSAVTGAELVRDEVEKAARRDGATVDDVLQAAIKEVYRLRMELERALTELQNLVAPKAAFKPNDASSPAGPDEAARGDRNLNPEASFDVAETRPDARTDVSDRTKGRDDVKSIPHRQRRSEAPSDLSQPRGQQETTQGLSSPAEGQQKDAPESPSTPGTAGMNCQALTRIYFLWGLRGVLNAVDRRGSTT